MRLVVGVDVGNTTTEACLARVGPDGAVAYLGTALMRTTGVKGTPENADGAVAAVRAVLARVGPMTDQLHAVLLNEATPVISGLAMETITETIITESTMIGHNPATPGGVGLGVGVTVPIGELLGDRSRRRGVADRRRPGRLGLRRRGGHRQRGGPRRSGRGRGGAGR